MSDEYTAGDAEIEPFAFTSKDPKHWKIHIIVVSEVVVVAAFKAIDGVSADIQSNNGFMDISGT